MRDLAHDSWTVAQKELHELLVSRRHSTLSIILVVTFIVLLGIVLPVKAGPRWLDNVWLLSLWSWVAVFLVANSVADFVAGERERHTLETLLASRLPDRAILFGKVGAGVIAGWGLMLITIVTSVVAINLVYARDQLILYRPQLLVGGALLSLLASVLAALFATLVSLRAASVRRAQQYIAATLITLFVLQVGAMPVVFDLLPNTWRLSLDIVLGALNRWAVFLGLAIGLLVLNAILLYVSEACFRRTRLKLN